MKEKTYLGIMNEEVRKWEGKEKLKKGYIAREGEKDGRIREWKHLGPFSLKKGMRAKWIYVERKDAQ